MWKLIPESVETVGKLRSQPTCTSDQQWQHFLTQQHHSQTEAFSFSLIRLWIKADPFQWTEPAMDRRDWEWGQTWLTLPCTCIFELALQHSWLLSFSTEICALYRLNFRHCSLSQNNLTWLNPSKLKAQIEPVLVVRAPRVCLNSTAVNYK